MLAAHAYNFTNGNNILRACTLFGFSVIDGCEAFALCENGATCAAVDTDGNFTCECVPGYTGTLCENGNHTFITISDLSNKNSDVDEYYCG